MSASLPKLASVLLIVEIAKEKEKEGQLLSRVCYNYRTTKKKKLTGFCIASLSLDLCFFRGNDFCACSLRGFLLRIRCFRTVFDPLLIQKRLIGQYSTFFRYRYGPHRTEREPNGHVRTFFNTDAHVTGRIIMIGWIQTFFDADAHVTGRIITIGRS